MYGNTAKDGTGDFHHILLDAGGRQIITEYWYPDLEYDDDADDSDKTFTVPSDTEWYVQWIWVKLVTTATANDRQLVVEIQDDLANVIAQIRAGAVQAPSQTRYYLFGIVNELAAFRDTDFLSTIMPQWYLPEDYVVRVYDNTARDPAADDMTVSLMRKARSIA